MRKLLDAEVTFCVVADLHGPAPCFPTLVERIAEEEPDVVLIPGDLVNADGADLGPWERFEEGFQPFVDAGLRFRAIPGNHDLDGDVDAARGLWQERLDPPNGSFFCSFDEGGAHFTGLGITRGLLHEEFDLPEGRMTQLEWMRRDLEASRQAPWRFIFHHEPGDRFCRLSTPDDGPGTPDVSEHVEPLAFREGVDLMFRGHQHLYERTYPIDPESGQRDDARGVTFITVGTGHGGSRPIKAEDGTPLWFDAVVSVHQAQFLTVRITGDVLVGESKNLDGAVCDRFTIRKAADGTREWDGLPESPVFFVEGDRRFV